MSLTASERFAEAAGPIVVKEVRQGLRGRVFTIFFSTLLVVCFGVALVAFADAAEAGGSTSGQSTFGAFLTALGGVCFFVIPFAAFRSMLREMEDETWVLLSLTGLGPRSITRGKWASAMSQAMLFGSACAPFVLFTYFLNGVSLVQIVECLSLAVTWTALLTAVGVALATQPRTRLGRAIIHFVVLGVLGAGAVVGIVLAWQFSRHAASGDAGRNAVIGGLLFQSLLTWLVLEGAAASLALPTEPASREPRFALIVVSLGALVFGAAVFIAEHGRRNDAAAGQVIVMAFLTVAMFACLSEADGWPARVPVRGFLSKPGALRSATLIVGLMTLSTVMWLGLVAVNRDASERSLRGILAAYMYPLLYGSLAVLLGRLTPLRNMSEPGATRAGFVIAVGAGMVLSMVSGLLFDNRADSQAFNALNPVFGLANFLGRDYGAALDGAIVLLFAVTLLFTFLASVVLWNRDQERR